MIHWHRRAAFLPPMASPWFSLCHSYSLASLSLLGYLYRLWAPFSLVYCYWSSIVLSFTLHSMVSIEHYALLHHFGCWLNITLSFSADFSVGMSIALSILESLHVGGWALSSHWGLIFDNSLSLWFANLLVLDRALRSPLPCWFLIEHYDLVLNRQIPPDWAFWSPI
jgi:hypothetical protein